MDDFPKPQEPFIDTVTGATPKVEEITISVVFEKDIEGISYIEMNVSEDYNKYFPKVSSKNVLIIMMRDTHLLSLEE